jgi:uncharacterized DUF497 family protein
VLLEWDEAKRLSNLEDHGVDFKDAALIFERPVLLAEDKRNDYGEPRFRALGRVGDDIFMAAFTWRGEARRIISAWRVDDDGKRRYEAILGRKPSGGTGAR